MPRKTNSPEAIEVGGLHRAWTEWEKMNGKLDQDGFRNRTSVAIENLLSVGRMGMIRVALIEFRLVG